MKTGIYTISDYLKELSSKEPVPGGGGVAALAAALGVALANMVCSLTVGKKRYLEYEKDIKRIIETAKQRQDEFLAFADEDAAAFLPLSKAYSMPKETEEEKKARSDVMQKALRDAAEVPFKLIHTCADSVELFEELLIKGSVLAMSDVGVGAQMLVAAAHGAILNVFINTKLMDDKEYVQQMNEQATSLVEAVEVRLNAVIDEVTRKVKA